MLRFGITMRIANAVDYNEPRDAIALDWSNYMLAAFPNFSFTFIPNIKEKVISFIRNSEINVLILTGGDDIGVFPRRDKTELIALEYAVNNGIPVIAICRGMQLVNTYYNGKNKEGNIDFINRHRAKRHNIIIEGKLLEVNSFHNNMIEESLLRKEFEIFARCQLDNSIEGFRNEKILAMMWHPEREDVVMEWNKLLIKKFITNG